MKKIIALLIILVLSGCSKDSDNSSNKDSDTKDPVKESTVSKPAKKAQEVDEHHGHNHGPAGGEANEIGGYEYVTLDAPYDTNNNEKVVIYEFFGYPCGHCYNFEPQMTEWTKNKPDYVEVVKIPLNFNHGWGVLQQGYLTASSMGIADENHAKLFAAIHQQRKNFRTIDELAAWYAENSDVTKEAFLSTAQSFVIDSQQRKSDKMGFMMKVTGTPTIVINGKFKPINKLKSREDVFTVMNLLAEKEAKEMGLLKP